MALRFYGFDAETVIAVAKIFTFEQLKRKVKTADTEKMKAFWKAAMETRIAGEMRGWDAMRSEKWIETTVGEIENLYWA